MIFIGKNAKNLGGFMKRNIKTILSALLVVTVLFTSVMPAFARSQYYSGTDDERFWSKRDKKGGTGETIDAGHEPPKSSVSKYKWKDVSEEDALLALQNSSLVSGDSMVVKFKNADKITLSTLRTMERKSELPLVLVADSTTEDNKAVDVRLTLKPSESKRIINLKATTFSDAAKSIKDSFEKLYGTSVVVVDFAQKGNFDQTVNVSVNSAGSLNTKNLVFYNYNSETGKLENLPNVKYSADSNGYINFSTTTGDYIVISGLTLSR